MGNKLLWLSGLCAAVGVCLLKLHVDAITEAAWGGPPIEVVVLTEDLPAGARLSERRLAVADRPERYVESRHIPRARMDGVIGLRTGLPVKAGETLMWSDVAGMRSAPRQLSALVPEGTRAVPVRVRKEDFSGMVHPGDRVDVLGSRGGTTYTVLQNVLVLAVGNNTGGPRRQRSGAAGQLTVNVTPRQAEALASAELAGALRVTLRNPSDSLIVEGS